MTQAEWSITLVEKSIDTREGSMIQEECPVTSEGVHDTGGVFKTQVEGSVIVVEVSRHWWRVHNRVEGSVKQMDGYMT